MNSQTVKTTNVVLDENEVWMLASVVSKFYRSNSNRADRSDWAELLEKLRNEAKGFMQ